MSLPLNQVILGDCIEVMAEWPENSVDCVVTDPPYGISFMGKEWDRALPPVAAFEQMFRVLKPGALAFVMSSPRQDVLWRMLAMLEGVGLELRQSFISWIYRTGFPKAYDVSKGIDRKLGFERGLVGYRKLNIRDKKAYPRKAEMGYHGGDKGGFREVTEPASDLAEQWEGWKSQTGLKPAAECILMVNKPRSEPTIVDNVLRWGTGAMNVDACRIPFHNQADVEQRQKNDMGSRPNKGQNYGRMGRVYDSGHGTSLPSFKSEGRFPANLLISDGALDTGETTKTGNITPEQDFKKTAEGYVPANVYGKYKRIPYTHEGDEGSPFRFFDLDAWAVHHGFLDVAKPSRAERDFGLKREPSFRKTLDGGKLPRARAPSRMGSILRNIHPTVKPVKLMAYLIELGCPPDGVVVDPFVGSGTTCIAARQLRRKWIGIEINPEYAEIAEARINIRGPLDQFMEAEK